MKCSRLSVSTDRVSLVANAGTSASGTAWSDRPASCTVSTSWPSVDSGRTLTQALGIARRVQGAILRHEPAPSHLTPASRDLAIRNQRQRPPRRFLPLRVVTPPWDKREDQPEPTHARAPNAADLRTVGRWTLGSIEGHAWTLG